MKRIIYWGTCSAIALVGGYLILHQNINPSFLVIGMAGWVLVFQLYEQLQLERAYQNDQDHFLRVRQLSWRNVVSYAGLLGLMGLNFQHMSFPLVTIGLGSILIALGFYNRAVRFYRITPQGIWVLNQDRLIGQQAIGKIRLTDQGWQVEMLDGSDPLIIPRQKEVAKKEALFEMFRKRSDGA